MRVIWHDDERMETESNPIEMKQDIRQVRPMFCFTERAGALALVQPSLDPLAETAMIIAFNVGGPRLRIVGDPSVPFSFPCPSQRSWQRIGDTKGQEIGGLVLFPMGKPSARLGYGGVRIEKANCFVIHVIQLGAESLLSSESDAHASPRRGDIPVPGRGCKGRRKSALTGRGRPASLAVAVSPASPMRMHPQGEGTFLSPAADAKAGESPP